MKKICCGLLLLSVAYSAQAMFLFNRAKSLPAMNKRIIVGQKRFVPVQKRAFSTHNTSAPKEETMRVSEKCYQDWQNIREDAAKLKYYMQGVFNGMGESGRDDVRPSAILQFLRDKSDINDATKLKFMSATRYMHSFITDEDYLVLDNAFEQKYNETKNVSETWNWFNERFAQQMKDSLEIYTKDMMERDAAKVTLAEQGICFEDNGRTIIFDISRMSEDSEEREKVREALDRLYKE